MIRARKALVGLTFLHALVLPGAVRAQQCPQLGCDDIRSSAKSDIRLVGDVVYGTVSCDGDYWKTCTTLRLMCGYYPGDWGLDPVYRTYPPTGGYSGIANRFGECERQQTCEWRSTITSNFRLGIVPGAYEFRWQVASCVLSSQVIYLPAQSWDAPTCSTCIGDSATACVHPTPRSLVVSSRPDLTLRSPLGDRTISRTYRTSLVGDPDAGDGMFGAGWRAGFEYHVGAPAGSASTGVMLFDAAGRKIFYHRDFHNPWKSTPPPTAMADRSPETLTDRISGRTPKARRINSTRPGTSCR